MGSYLAKQPDMLSKLLHSCSDHLSPRWTKDRLEFSCRRHRGFWPRPHARTHAQNKQLSQQRSQINARRFIPTAVWVTDCRSVSAALSTNGSFCISLYSGTKGQLKCVCVRAWGDYDIPALFFPKAFTYKSRVSNTHCAAKSNKHTKKMESCFTQGAWESFWPLPKAGGGV